MTALLTRDRVARTLDPGLALLILAIGLFEILVRPMDTTVFVGPAGIHIAFLAACSLPLAWRRRAPMAVLIAVVAATQAWFWLIFGGITQGPFEGFVATLAAVYTASVHLGGRERRIAAAVIAAMVALDVAALVLGRTIDNTLPAWVLYAAAWGVGVVVRSRVRLASELQRTAERLDAEREARLAQAVLEERARIARELHDVITHSVSVMVIQAGVEARQRRDTDPEVADVLHGIEQSGRDALVELRRLLGVLRTGPDHEALTPSPTLRELDALVAQVRRPGLAVSLTCEGVPDDLPAGVDLSAYRILQEALTNVLKHGRDASRVAVVVRGVHGAIELDVHDDGSTNGAVARRGNGIVGMHERAALHDGVVEAGPSAQGGWRVHARLPLASQ